MRLPPVVPVLMLLGLLLVACAGGESTSGRVCVNSADCASGRCVDGRCIDEPPLGDDAGTLGIRRRDAGVDPTDAGASPPSSDAGAPPPPPPPPGPDAGPPPPPPLPEPCDGACAPDETCMSDTCVRVEWRWEAEGPSMGHAVGRADADGWSASTALDGAGTLVYGPYTRELPAGACVVWFRMMVDNNAGTDVVARIDVNDYDQRVECGDCVIARADIRRNQFTGTLAYQDFTIAFTSPGAGHRIELRTTWNDRAYIREDNITVRCPP